MSGTLVVCATTSRSGSCPRSAASPSPKIVWTSTSATRMTASARCVKRVLLTAPGRRVRTALGRQFGRYVRVSHVESLSVPALVRLYRIFTRPGRDDPTARGGELRSRGAGRRPVTLRDAVSRTWTATVFPSIASRYFRRYFRRQRRGRASRFRPAPTTPPDRDGLSGLHSSRTHVASSVVTSGDV